MQKLNCNKKGTYSVENSFVLTIAIHKN